MWSTCPGWPSTSPQRSCQLPATLNCLRLLKKEKEGGDLGEEGLLLEDGEDAERLLEHGDAGLEVHPEVNHLPVDPLLHVLLLLQHEPGVASKNHN